MNLKKQMEQKQHRISISIIILLLAYCYIFDVTAVTGFPIQDKKSTQELNKAATQIFDKAKQLFKEGAYWNSARELCIIMDYYPEFLEMDGVVYHMAECLFESEINAASNKMYKYLIQKFPYSRYIPDALFGLEKSFYKEGDYKNCLNLYYQILKVKNNSDVIDAARYFAGQCHYNLKNYDTAINVLKYVDSSNKYYDGALYTIALSYLRKKSVPTSISYFKKVISLPVISGERRKIVDSARLTLGYIYFELNTYDKAAELFADISDIHDDYQDALLAEGWAHLKMSNFERTLKPLLKLVNFFPEGANAEEAYFLLGQAYIMLEQYDKAIESYNKIVQLFPNNLQNTNIIKATNSCLALEQDKIEKLKVQILIEESKLLTTLPINVGDDDTPKHLIKEQKKLEQYRDGLITALLNERDNIGLLQIQIDTLRKLADRKERRKDWRGYAEYGISRALFLKELSQRAN